MGYQGGPPSAARVKKAEGIYGRRPEKKKRWPKGRNDDKHIDSEQKNYVPERGTKEKEERGKKIVLLKPEDHQVEKDIRMIRRGVYRKGKKKHGSNIEKKNTTEMGREREIGTRRHRITPIGETPK